MALGLRRVVQDERRRPTPADILALLRPKPIKPAEYYPVFASMCAEHSTAKTWSDTCRALDSYPRALGHRSSAAPSRESSVTFPQKSLQVARVGGENLPPTPMSRGSPVPDRHGQSAVAPRRAGDLRQAHLRARTRVCRQGEGDGGRKFATHPYAPGVSPYRGPAG
jgi:hypothetical protein